MGRKRRYAGREQQLYLLGRDTGGRIDVVEGVGAVAAEHCRLIGALQGCARKVDLAHQFAGGQAIDQGQPPSLLCIIAGGNDVQRRHG